MGAEELLVVKLSDISQQEAVKAAVDSRIATQLNNFDGYGVEQTEMLNSSITLVEGNYILFVSGNDAEAVAASFREGL